MIRTVIIEDEKAAQDNLLYHIGLTKEPISVIAMLETVDDTVHWFSQHPQPDLIFMDIHLRDGISFSIFDRIKISAPIIYVTAFDHFLVEAFGYTGIEFLLKPVTKHELSGALVKYKNLQNCFVNNHENLLAHLAERAASLRSRIIVRRGIEYKSVALDDVVYFISEQRFTFLVTKDEKKYSVDKNLTKLEEELNPQKFYRANRRFIINDAYIKGYKTYDKIKIEIELTIPVTEKIIVAQENISGFKKWLSAL